VLRHKTDPLQFKIIATAAGGGALGEEYVLDLSAKDLLELTEGKNSILKASEPKELIDRIIENLIIAVN
jgi:hypothetical protein